MAAKRKSLMRSLGEFAGHIIKGVRTPAEAETRQQVSRTVEERTEDGVTLRRTTIDEIELPATRKDEHVSD